MSVTPILTIERLEQLCEIWKKCSEHKLPLSGHSDDELIQLLQMAVRHAADQLSLQEGHQQFIDDVAIQFIGRVKVMNLGALPAAMVDVARAAYDAAEALWNERQKRRK